MIGGKVNQETEHKARSQSGPAQGDVGRPGSSQVLVKQTRRPRAGLPPMVWLPQRRGHSRVAHGWHSGVGGVTGEVSTGPWKKPPRGSPAEGEYVTHSSSPTPRVPHSQWGGSNVSHSIGLGGHLSLIVRDFEIRMCLTDYRNHHREQWPVFFFLGVKVMVPLRIRTILDLMK